MRGMSTWRRAFLDSIRSVRSPKTVESYGTASKRFETFLAAWGKNIENCPKNALSTFVSTMSRDGLAPASVHLYAAGASQFLQFCRDGGADIPEQIKPKYPRVKEKVPVVLKEETLAVYVEVAKTIRDPYKTALLLLPLTGLRVSELCFLTLGDLDIEPPWVRFHVSGKSKKDRIVPMLSSGKPILARYLKYVRPELPGDEWLFPNQDGDPISKRTVQKKMRQVRGKIGINNLTPHTLRHTYLTILNENGITGFDLAEIAGHKNLSTSRLYVHPSASKLSEMVAKVETPWMKGS